MVKLSEWQRGVCFTPPSDEEMRMYLWFYEWHLFDAVDPGQHTPGPHEPNIEVSSDGSKATLTHPGRVIDVTAREDGADLTFTVTNESDRAWPDIAGLIPCFNPGGSSDTEIVQPNPRMFDDAHERTWFVGAGGLENLVRRDIHFNSDLRETIDAEANDGNEFAFTRKWPTSHHNAEAGLILRESTDLEWVAGIAWDRFVSAQGHNPWRCMHLATKIGPLAPGESTTLKGRIYLFGGTAAAAYRRFREEFS